MIFFSILKQASKKVWKATEKITKKKEKKRKTNKQKKTIETRGLLLGCEIWNAYYIKLTVKSETLRSLLMNFVSCSFNPSFNCHSFVFLVKAKRPMRLQVFNMRLKDTSFWRNDYCQIISRNNVFAMFSLSLCRLHYSKVFWFSLYSLQVYLYIKTRKLYFGSKYFLVSLINRL